MIDLVLRNARLMNSRSVDIGITNGVITVIAPHIDDAAQSEIDAENCLTLPAFVNGQLHACKSFWRRLLQTLPEEIQQLPPQLLLF